MHSSATPGASCTPHGCPVMGSHLQRQARSRENLRNAARRWAELAGAGMHVGEIDAGEITNRAGVRQRLTVYINVVPVEGEHAFLGNGTECRACDEGRQHYLHTDRNEETS